MEIPIWDMDNTTSFLAACSRRVNKLDKGSGDASHTKVIVTKTNTAHGDDGILEPLMVIHSMGKKLLIGVGPSFGVLLLRTKPSREQVLIVTRPILLDILR